MDLTTSFVWICVIYVRHDSFRISFFVAAICLVVEVYWTRFVSSRENTKLHSLYDCMSIDYGV